MSLAWRCIATSMESISMKVAGAGCSIHGVWAMVAVLVCVRREWGVLLACDDVLCGKLRERRTTSLVSEKLCFPTLPTRAVRWVHSWLRPQLVLPSRATLTGSVSPCTSVMHLTKALARGPGPCRVVSIIVTGRPLRLGGILKAIGKCFPTLLTLCLSRPFAVRWVRSWQRTRCHDDADNATSSRRASAVVRCIFEVHGETEPVRVARDGSTSCGRRSAPLWHSDSHWQVIALQTTELERGNGAACLGTAAQDSNQQACRSFHALCTSALASRARSWQRSSLPCSAADHFLSHTRCTSTLAW